MGLVLLRHRVVVVSGRPEVVRQAGLLNTAASVEEALEAEAARLGRAPRVLALPDAVAVLPYPAP